jgi:hypothetical protein
LVSTEGRLSTPSSPGALQEPAFNRDQIAAFDY